MATLTGAIGYPQATSVTVAYSSTAPLKIALGTRARDAAGNEYVYVNFDAAKAVGELVTFDTDYLATACGAATVGYVGIVCGEASSSDRAGWVQVYGINTNCVANSGLTSGFLTVAATTDGYSVPAIAGTITTDITYAIVGMNAVTSASTATSPGMSSLASSILGVFTARLNYPYVDVRVATS